MNESAPSPAEPQQPPIAQSSPPLQGERVTFTGTLASMTHEAASELVEQHGGIATHHVSKQTTMLVVGEEGWPLEEDGKPSVKLQQVTQWQHEGLPIRIVAESTWLNLLGIDDRRKEVHRLYTPAMLHQLLGVTVHQIRSWERRGLIKPIRKVFRLPYFDFDEVSNVRRLSEWLAAGISREKLEESLEHIKQILPDIEQPLTQLDLLLEDSHLLFRDDHGLVDPLRGQRLFDFESCEAAADPAAEAADSALPLDQPLTNFFAAYMLEDSQQPRWSTQEWSKEGCRLLDQHRLEEAVEAFRMSLMLHSNQPDVHFLLADTLYRLDNPWGALERYYVAVEWDENFLEAWTQIGCLNVELGQREDALDAFTLALRIHPEYPDAHWHRAELLHELGRTDEAVVHWRTYLEFDRSGPWAENARQQLALATGDVDGEDSPALPCSETSDAPVDR